MSRRFLFVISLAVIVAALATLTVAQQPASNAHLFAEMRWRNIGPLRGGRTRAITGVPGQPHAFYIGATNGGVWKTTDAGRTWKSLFDDQPTTSIGDIAVAPSDPNIVYVVSGEGLQRPDLSVGDGVYKSTNAGKTWTHLPQLRDAQQMPRVAVDPVNPNRLFIAALGHPYGPNEERGIYRSMDGGQTFKKTLYKDENTGGADVMIDPTNPNIVFASMWEGRQGPWENAAWIGTGGGIYKSIDGGETWRQLLNTLPVVVQANLAMSATNPKRLYAAIASLPAPAVDTPASTTVAIYRSDDAGETWSRPSEDTRPAGRIGGGDLPVPAVDPKNPDDVVIASTVSYRSLDGGKTWTGFRGAPGGDDYQRPWISPDDSNIIGLASDQGALISLNGGETWSSWYNQSTAAMYHVAADNAFPYRVCSGQQDSGSACVSSRGVDGQITMREWHPIGVEEYGYAAPDPQDPDLVYGGKVTRYDRRTGQVSQVGPVAAPGRGGAGVTPAPSAPAYRTVRTLPLVFSTVDLRALFFANNVLWKTIDGGINWKQISPDLTRKIWSTPKSIGKYFDQPTAQPAQKGVIYTIGPSYLDVSRIWIGTDDGVIQTTSDGGLHWNDVTPQQMAPWMKVFMVEPGRFDTQTAYAAVNTLRLDDMRPHIFRTHDGGKTWTEIVTGMTDAGPSNSIREDPKRKGLLYASTERAVFVSFDDGDHWESLRLNMPASSVRDIIVKDDDLVAATHGRGFWILDDVTPLRQIDAKTASSDVLFKPEPAYRVRWNTNSDTPIPPDETNGQNPPEGAMLNYALKSAATGPVTLEVFHADGKLVRRYSSADPLTHVDPATAPVPVWWYRPMTALAATPGMHRFLWDLHYQPVPGPAGGGGRAGGLPSAAVPYSTAPAPTTPWVAPGDYVVKLTVNGKTYSQPLTVRMDPRVKTSSIALQQIFDLSKALYYGVIDAQTAMRQIGSIRDQVAKLEEQAKGPAETAMADLDKLNASLQASGQTAAQIKAIRDAIDQLKPKAPSTVVQALTGFDKKLAALQADSPPGAGRAGSTGPAGTAVAPATPATSLAAAIAALSGQMNALQAADVRPTALALSAIDAAEDTAAQAMAKWDALKTVDLPALNLKLKAAGLSPITLPTT